MKFELMCRGFSLPHHGLLITTHLFPELAPIKAFSAEMFVYIHACFASRDRERKFLNQMWSPTYQLVAGPTRNNRRSQNNKGLKNISVFFLFYMKECMATSFWMYDHVCFYLPSSKLAIKFKVTSWSNIAPEVQPSHLQSMLAEGGFREAQKANYNSLLTFCNKCILLIN